MNNPLKTLTINDNSYPFLLKEIYNPPQKLYYKGNLNILEKTCISIVGTRRYSDYGEFMTEKIIEELAILDIAIVSGLAKGIDTIAHKTALKNNIPTIAVLGSGIENIYPKQNISLAKIIEQKGLLFSEYEPYGEPLNFHFPERNRIISGLCIATIVIEAPEKSGALITAKLALEQGREIFAVPADADRETSKGIIRLLQQGAAYPVSSGQDIIEVLKKQPHLFEMKKRKILNNPAKISGCNINKPPKLNLTQDESAVYESLTRRPQPLDQLLIKTQLRPQNLLSAISFLEIKNLILIKDGKYARKLLK